MTEKPISVFFSYSHKDEELRAELAKHLIILERRKVIHSWHDQEILAGAEKDDEIDRNLKTADIILLLVSVDFIASDYCYEIEVKLAMKRHNSGNACVIPILLRPVGFEGTPFEKLKSLPSNNQPVTRWESKDLAFQEISKEIEKVISNIRRKNSETLPVRPSKTLNQQGERRENIANNNPPASSQEDATSKLQEDKENKRIFCISTSQKNSNLFTIESLSREENLSLAWQRVLTSSNKDYKQLNLESYEAFGWNQKEKINLLSLEIRNETYSPSGSSKYYLPKNSGLVRPITVLSVKDQIFYQAVANLVCEARLEEIKRFRKNLVYGGFNIDSPKSIFFLSSWKDEYEAYKNTIRTKFDSGFQWICKFDLASFYDVIDHKILVEADHLSPTGQQFSLPCRRTRPLQPRRWRTHRRVCPMTLVKGDIVLVPFPLPI